MKKYKVLILGATGMAGSMIQKVLTKDDSFRLGLSVRSPDEEFHGKGYEVFVFDALKSSPFFAKDYDFIINCIGAIPSSKSSTETSVKLNTLFPIELAKNCPNSKIIHLTTDCIFDCKISNFSPNDEISSYYGLDAYAYTKHLGEVSAPNVMNLRCSIIGPELKEFKSFFERFLADKNPKGWNDVEWNGITTYHLAQIIKGIIKNNLFKSGVQHVVPNGKVTRFQMMQILNELNWGVGKKNVEPISRGSSLNRVLSTTQTLDNLLLWKGAGYASAPDFTTMALELNKMYWQLGYAKQHGFVLGEGEY